jgi:SAM-dependent methyltransferase
LRAVRHEVPSGSFVPFDPAARYFADRVAYDVERLTELRRLAAQAPGRHALEVGAAPYILTSALLEDGFDMTVANMPIGEPERGTAILQVGDVEHACPLLLQDVEDGLPFADEQFDLIVAGEIIEHFFRQPWRFIAEAWRCLRPGGLLVASTPNGESLDVLLGWLRRGATGHGFNPKAPGVRHAREYSPGEMRELLRSQGFDAEVRTQAYSHVVGGYAGRLGPLKRRVRGVLDDLSARPSGVLADRANTLLISATKSDREPGSPPDFMVYTLDSDERSGWNFP